MRVCECLYVCVFVCGCVCLHVHVCVWLPVRVWVPGEPTHAHTRVHVQAPLWVLPSCFCKLVSIRRHQASHVFLNKNVRTCDAHHFFFFYFFLNFVGQVYIYCVCYPKYKNICFRIGAWLNILVSTHVLAFFGLAYVTPISFEHFRQEALNTIYSMHILFNCVLCLILCATN